MKKLVAVVVAVSATLALAGCNWDTHGSSADPSPSDILKPNTQVYQMPQGFRNVVAFCDGTTRVYVTSRSVSDALPSGITAVPNAPQCTK